MPANSFRCRTRRQASLRVIEDWRDASLFFFRRRLRLRAKDKIGRLFAIGPRSLTRRACPCNLAILAAARFTFRNPRQVRTSIQSRPRPPVPQPLAVRPTYWRRRSTLILLLAAGAASAIAGAFFLPGTTGSRSEDRRSRSEDRRSRIEDGEPGPETATVPLILAPRPSTLEPRPAMPPVKPLRPAGHAADLAVFIDQRLDAAMASAGVPASPLADDGEFLRRAYLDLIGHIPTHAAAVAFLDSRDPYKRARLVDELLASPEFGQHFAQIWTDTLVKRDLDNNRGLQTDGFSSLARRPVQQGHGLEQGRQRPAHGRGPGRPGAGHLFLPGQPG